MHSDHIVSVPNKSQLSNYRSKLLLNVVGPGLRDIRVASGRLARGCKPHGHLVLLRGGGEVVKAKRTKCDWKPYRVTAEFEFPGGPHVKQRSWVDWPFVHSNMTIEGDLAGARLAAEGVSFQEAKAFVSRWGSVIVEEMDPAFKPFVLEVASSVSPESVVLSSDGKNWQQTDFAWSEDAVHYRMIFDGNPRELTISAHLGKTSEFLGREQWECARGREDEVEREWIDAYRDQFPDIDCPDPRFRDLVQYCYYVHRSGVIDPGGMLPYPYVVPSKVTYPAWWMWDTAFHAVVDAWMKDPSVAHGDLLNHTTLQTRKGCIQDAAGEFVAVTGQGRWINPQQYDNFPPPSTGPCVTGIAVWDVYQKTGSLDFLKRMYPHLVLYERWLVSEKASGLDPDLIAYKNWYDVGWDDSKRWGKTGMKDVPDAKVDWDLPVVPVDGNVFLAMLRDTLSEAADLLRDVDRARDYADKSERTRRAIERHMWNDDERFYFDVLPDGRMLSVWTPAGFVPLLAGMCCPDRYHLLREHLLDPNKFWCKYPLPTLSLDDEYFSTTNWWRGGTWPVINWQVNEGVFRYDPETGLRLLLSTVEMMTNGGRPTCNEFYNPIDGRPSGAVDQGWGAMPVDLILRRLFGLSPMPDRLQLSPYLPADWPEARVKNVFAAGTSVDIGYTRSGDGFAAHLANTGEKPILICSESGEVKLGPGKKGKLEVPRFCP